MSSLVKSALDFCSFKGNQQSCDYIYSRVVYNISNRVGVYCIIKYIVLAAYTCVVYIHMTYLYNDLFYYIISDADRHAISSKKKIPNLSDKCYCHVRQTTRNNNGKYMYTQTQYSIL